MIRRIVDFALDQKLLVLAFTLLLIAAGAVAFHSLPVDAYPDVADNYVEVITQWPGISAEQVEQQVTVPLETALNGIPHVVHLRSFSRLRPLRHQADFRRRLQQRLEPRAGSRAA